mgnify:FL=1|tara:strand:+ start:6456 stop:6806 length:351 start_codon:yes stop_codon:yes gene_type:complete
MESQLDSAFAALADSSRRAILGQLRSGEATVNELVAPLAISQPAVSRHLKILERAGLITRRAEGTKRYCKLASQALDNLEAYLGLLRSALDANYLRLDPLLDNSQPSSDRKKKSKR